MCRKSKIRCGGLMCLISFVLLSLLGPATIVSADLIGYWPLDEGAGFTTADMSPAEYGFDGTLVGGPTWTGGQFGKTFLASGNRHNLRALADQFQGDRSPDPARRARNNRSAVFDFASCHLKCHPHGP